MKSVKSKLTLTLGLVALLTLGMAAVLYVGAQRFEDDARRTRHANDDLRELLDFSLAAHAYMDAFGRSLGQRTLIANRERRDAAEAFESLVRRIPEMHRTSLQPLDWQRLQNVSNELSAGLRAADVLRASGDFVRAEQRFVETRQSAFKERMLPWFAAAISTLQSDAKAREADAVNRARWLRWIASAFAGVSPIFAALAVLWISGAVIRPVRALVAGAEAIARGDLEHRVKHVKVDEFAVVADSFNRMASTIAATQETLVEKNKKLEEAYRMQGEFVSVVTHELRSPLHSIRGYLEFIEEDEPGLCAQSKKNLGNIGEGAKRLLRLVDDILDFSKLEAKQLQIVCSRFALMPLLEEALFDARALLQSRPVELVLEAPQGELYLETDYTRLRQILTNLLTNAIKFTERGRVTLAVEVHDEQVELVVSDTGIGIEASQLGAIFQPFRQATRAGEKAFGGTGLGLAIVARLTGLIGASVAVQSEPGRGSEFRVVLPKEASARMLLAG